MSSFGADRFRNEDKIPPSFLIQCQDTELIEVGSDRFFCLTGIDTDSATELNRQNIIPNKCKLERMALQISANAANSDSVLALRINGVDGNSLITVPAGVTGSFQDLTNSDEVANLDLVGYRFNKGGADEITIVATAIEVRKIQ